MSKLKLWNEKEWDEGAERASLIFPIKKLDKLPHMQGITEETKKHLKWKSFKWILLKDHSRAILKGFLRHPLKYFSRFISSLLQKKSYGRQGDFFFYGCHNLKEFEELLVQPNSLFVLGFSYCHKPFECPSGRFTEECIHNPNHLVCRQCFIGKAFNAISDKHAISLCIPTVHYIGEKMFEFVHKHPKKQIIFIITACELTLEMFGDFGNMVGIKGIGVRLDGRICNTMKAFELSEQGIKPGLTVVLKDTQTQILQLLAKRH